MPPHCQLRHDKWLNELDLSQPLKSGLHLNQVILPSPFEKKLKFEEKLTSQQTTEAVSMWSGCGVLPAPHPRFSAYQERQRKRSIEALMLALLMLTFGVYWLAWILVLTPRPGH